MNNNVSSFCEKKLARLNDQLRTNPFAQGNGIFVMSGSVGNLSDVDQIICIKSMADFKDFNSINAPCPEHDQGVFSVTLSDSHQRTLFFKIDYYDPDLTSHSENKLDASKTTRVLTLGFAGE